MKNLGLLFLLCFLALGTVIAQESDEVSETIEATDGPQMTFESKEMNYGEIAKGSDPLRQFHFTNTGNAPLVIQNAKGSCGCTVPDYPKEPIMPGEAGVIDVRYDTKRVGPFTKSVTLTTNIVGEESITLKIKGKVNNITEADEKSVPENNSPF